MRSATLRQDTSELQTNAGAARFSDWFDFPICHVEWFGIEYPYVERVIGIGNSHVPTGIAFSGEDTDFHADSVLARRGRTCRLAPRRADVRGLSAAGAWIHANERPDHTLQPTALVNEMFIRVFAGAAPHVADRRHLLAIAARQLRRILINYARDSRAAKRGLGTVKLSLEGLGSLPSREPPDLLDLDVSLENLQKLDPRAEQVVTLRYFAGLTEAGNRGNTRRLCLECTNGIGISLRTWLLRELSHR